jgi:heptosyltransferase-2
LLRAAGIRFRLGVAGYATGARSFEGSIPFDASEHVSRTALRLGEFLGALPGIEPRPQLFLSTDERRRGEAAWKLGQSGTAGPRVVLAPGAGLPVKSWPLESYRQLTERLALETSCVVAVSGGQGDRSAGENLAATSSAVVDRTGQSLREAFALVAACDYVICNSSMMLHVAAAFAKPALTLLGPAFHSAQAHQAVWGYPGLTWSLGREEPARSEIASVDEAMHTMRQLGWFVRCSR